VPRASRSSRRLRLKTRSVNDQATGTPLPSPNNGEKSPKGFLETLTGKIVALTTLVAALGGLLTAIQNLIPKSETRSVPSTIVVTPEPQRPAEMPETQRAAAMPERENSAAMPNSASAGAVNLSGTWYGLSDGPVNISQSGTSLTVSLPRIGEVAGSVDENNYGPRCLLHSSERRSAEAGSLTFLHFDGKRFWARGQNDREWKDHCHRMLCPFHLNGNPISQRKSQRCHPANGVSTSLLHPPLPALQTPIALPIFSREAVCRRWRWFLRWPWYLWSRPRWRCRRCRRFWRCVGFHLLMRRFNPEMEPNESR
jgi:hypothetical protein